MTETEQEERTEWAIPPYACKHYDGVFSCNHPDAKERGCNRTMCILKVTQPTEAANEGTRAGSNAYSDYVEVWKCEVCGVWEGCVHKSLKGEKPPKGCVRNPDGIPTWIKRSNQSLDDHSISATAPQQPSNDKVIMMIEKRIKNMACRGQSSGSYEKMMIRKGELEWVHPISHLF